MTKRVEVEIVDRDASDEVFVVVEVEAHASSFDAETGRGLLIYG
jgi:hypothetical protein